MGFYALCVTPLMTAVTSPSESMHHSSINPFYNIAFADDYTGCGKSESLKQWRYLKLGPLIGYYVNPTKTCLKVKDYKLEKVFWIFAGTVIKITSDDSRHLG